MITMVAVPEFIENIYSSELQKSLQLHVLKRFISSFQLFLFLSSRVSLVASIILLGCSSTTSIILLHLFLLRIGSGGSLS
jgi:hypothetical protein